ncbi:Cell division topological determinant MinJ [Pelotomaculum sp. FP]|nr:Cell division topological determinant MinJ [Pelotomaculum sp. FP]
MFPFLLIIPLILQAFLGAFMDPQFLSIFLVVMVLIAVQYRRMEKVRESFFGRGAGRIFPSTLVAAGFGLLGGLAGSIVMVVIGLTLSESGLIYLWPVAILLMLINMRFLCFSYAGGVLALSNLTLGFPDINVPQIIALVAVLHMVESFLILASGHLGAVPAYIKGHGGKVTGGFTLQKFWPIPIVVLAVVTGGTVENGINMPEWWPLLKTGVPGNPQDLIYALLPVVAGLGYGDIATARSPQEKSRLTALFLGAYSLTLLVLAVLAQHSETLALAAAVFSFLGHEAVIFAGRRIEIVKPPLYVPPEKGVRLLDVQPGGAAWQAGLRSGDVILALNGETVAGRDALFQRLKGTFCPVTVDYFSHTSREPRRATIRPPVQGLNWGLLPVPGEDEDQYVEMMTTGPLGRWLQQWWGKIRS